MDKYLSETINKFIILDNSLTQKYYSFIKNLVITSTGLLTAIISFTTSNSLSFINVCSRNITIGSIGLGILLSSIILYGEIHVLKLSQESLRKHINKLYRKENITEYVIQTDRPKFYTAIEILCFLSYFIFIVSIIIFGITRVK